MHWLNPYNGRASLGGVVLTDTQLHGRRAPMSPYCSTVNPVSNGWHGARTEIFIIIFLCANCKKMGRKKNALISHRNCFIPILFFLCARYRRVGQPAAAGKNERVIDLVLVSREMTAAFALIKMS